MIDLRPTAIAITGCVLAAAAAPQPHARQAQSGQTFRAATDVVTVDVSVQSDGVPVDGLSAADFVLLDNGVAQEVGLVSVEAVPIDVTLVVDTGEDVADDIAGMSASLQRIVERLRPDDEVRLMTAGPYVRELIPARRAAELMLPRVLPTSGKTSAHDALAAALLRRVDLDRRHLVIAVMNGIDAMSALEAADVRDIAERSGATLHIAQVDLVSDFGGGWIGGRQRLATYRCQVIEVCQATRHFWAPWDEHQFDTLDDAARATGGRFHFPGFLFIETAAEAFERAFADYRRSYLLRYTPTGVDRGGWHDIDVTVPGHPDYGVRARRGYSVEPTSGAEPAGFAAALLPLSGPAPVSSSPVPALAAVYDAGDYAAAYRQMREAPNLERLIREFMEGPTPWPANPHREAAFALELAHAGLQAGGSAVAAAVDLLTRQADLIRHPIEPSPFERYWHWARAAAIQNLGSFDLSGPFIEGSLTRFPDEPRFVLARALMLDQQRPSAVEGVQFGEALDDSGRGYVEEVLSRYEAAAAFDDTRDEAGMRAAWLLHRVGRHEEALSRLGSPPPVADPAVAYLRQLIRGRALEALGRLEDAADAFRAARDDYPDAQSAGIALMNVMLRLGDRAEADRLAGELQRLPEGAMDPWWAYWSGDYRMFGAIVARLREQTR